MRKTFQSLIFCVALLTTAILVSSCQSESSTSDTEPAIDCAEFATSNQKNELIPQIKSPTLAYDSERQKTVLFGGKINCTWEYNGNNWELIQTESSPPAESGGKLVYDSTRRTILLIDASSPNEIWQFDGTNWHIQHLETAFYPISSGWLTATYFPQKQATYVLGACREHCSDEGHYSGWLFDGNSWIEERIIPYGAKPEEPTFMAPEIVYDEDRETIVLQTGFGGKPVGSWALDYDGTEWRIVADESLESGMNDLLLFFDMAYDSNRKVTVLFGVFEHDEQLSAETWEYGETGWKQISPLESPSVRFFHSMAYDQARGVMVLYGGTNNENENPLDFYETWEYDGTTWTQK